MAQPKNVLKKILPAKGETTAKRKTKNPNMPQTTAGLLLQLHSLVWQQAKAEALLRKNIDKILEYKHREAMIESCRKCEDAIAGAYFAEGGIQFHARILLEHASLLDPECDTVKTMRIRCYSSAISYMRDRTQKLERDCREWVQRVKDAEYAYQDEASFCKAIGFVPCLDRLRSMKEMSAQHLAEALSEARQIVQKNGQTVEQLLRRCQEQTPPVALRYTNLLRELRGLLNTETVDRLSTEEGWSPEEYAYAVAKFAAEVREQLLLKYPRPGACPDAGKPLNR